ncbi:DMT family transporter [Nocardioides humilatus]|nr:DMT family transporter [Nocardioides humilatus]
MTSDQVRGRLLPIAAGAFATSMMGSSIPVVGTLQDFPPLTAQSVRYAIAGLALLVWLVVSARRAGSPLVIPGLRDLVALVGLAATGLLGFNLAILLAQRDAEPGLVGAVVGAAPLVLAVLTPALARERPARAVLVGAALVVIGVGVMAGGGSWEPIGLFFAGLALLGEVCFTVLAVGVLKRLGALAVSTWCCLLAAAGGAVIAVVGEQDQWRDPTAGEVVAILYIALPVTVLGFACWYTAVGALGGDRAGVLLGLAPAVALVLGVVLGAQSVTAAGVGGVLLVGVGCAIGLAPRRTSVDLGVTL